MNPEAIHDSAALAGARIFDGTAWHDDKALLLAGGRIAGIRAVPELPPGIPVRTLVGGMLVPGFVDLQVNGGGGVLLNDTPTAEGIATICQAHHPSGTTALLPTLVTDTAATTERALAAGLEAQKRQIPGFLGLHLEGPHLSATRKGAHDPALIRPMTEADLERLIRAAPGMHLLLTTLAPENVTGAQIRRLTQAGIRVSLGHSDASFALAQEAAANGATLVTHLFNAMSPLEHRAPGMVGNALQNGALHAGLIADGIHVDPVSIAIALRAKQGPSRIFLVTDAMAIAGTDLKEFTLNGRMVQRRDGRLTLADGTLAGADTTMIQSVRFMHETIGLTLKEALRMASLYPAEAAGLPGIGHLRPGARADILHLSTALEVREVWIGGVAEGAQKLGA
jgi:N-acetylglucosamine-6-phosphate deacetylase